MLADRVALLVYGCSRMYAELVREEFFDRNGSEETDSLTVRLLRNGQCETSRRLTHVLFAHIAYREHARLEDLFRHSP